MGRRKKRTFTAQQKAEAVRLYKAVGNYSEVGRNLDIHPNVLRAWAKQTYSSFNLITSRAGNLASMSTSCATGGRYPGTLPRRTS